MVNSIPSKNYWLIRVASTGPHERTGICLPGRRREAHGALSGTRQRDPLPPPRERAEERRRARGRRSAASRDARGHTLSKAAINALPVGGFAGRIEVVESAAAVSACAALHAGALLAGCRVLGFDTESRPSFRRGERHPIALVQLATAELACLFRIDPERALPAALRELLECGDVIKVGQGPADEVRELHDRWGVVARPVADLIPVARAAGCAPLSLRGLAAAYLGVRISKGAQTSNWAAPRLSERQQRYAATDAWACREIYRAMGCPVSAVMEPADGAGTAIPRRASGRPRGATGTRARGGRPHRPSGG